MLLLILKWQWTKSWRLRLHLRRSGNKCSGVLLTSRCPAPCYTSVGLKPRPSFGWTVSAWSRTFLCPWARGCREQEGWITTQVQMTACAIMLMLVPSVNLFSWSFLWGNYNNLSVIDKTLQVLRSVSSLHPISETRRQHENENWSLRVIRWFKIISFMLFAGDKIPDKIH